MLVTNDTRFVVCLMIVSAATDSVDYFGKQREWVRHKT